MGITWKTMTFLSILAALVIIVHSVEDDYEPDYRDVRPRRFDAVTASYEQPWRISDMEPVVTQSTPADWSFSSQEEPPKRRRPGRKRKRRPPPAAEEDLIPQERHVYHEEYRPYQHEKLTVQGGVRRRRKQFDSRPPERPNTWTDEIVDADRPIIRKRGNKRKRPAVEETWPELSEFNGLRPNDHTGEYIDINNQPTESTKNIYNYDSIGQDNVQNDDTIFKNDSDEQYQSNDSKFEDDIHNTEYLHPSVDNNTDNHKNTKDEDKSLSEFSLEIQPPSDDIIDTHEKLSEKAVSTLNDTEKAKNNETLDPQILKQILKKSNGRSLSEILQQHNLSLVDLLHGKEKAISILIEDSTKNTSQVINDQFTKYPKVSNETNQVSGETRINKPNKAYQNRNIEQKPKASIRNNIIVKNIIEDQTTSSSQKPYIAQLAIENSTSLSRNRELEHFSSTEAAVKPSNSSENDVTKETTTKSYLRRRFPVGSRKRLRMRPMNNSTYKSQLNRDLIALTSRRYQLNRNTTRSREWKDMMPTLVKIYRKDESKLNNEKDLTKEIITTTFIPEETTTQQSFEDTKLSTLPDYTETDLISTNIQTDNISTESTQTITDFTVSESIITTTVITTPIISTTISTTTTQKPTEKSVLRPIVKASDLRRQAFNNRLKRKRLKQKTTTTESTQEYDMKNIFGMANLVSASEFIAKVQPRTTSNDEELDFTTLEDFMTTESTYKPQTKIKSSKIPKIQYSTNPSISTSNDVEETAKLELEEILNDTLRNSTTILLLRAFWMLSLIAHSINRWLLSILSQLKNIDSPYVKNLFWSFILYIYFIYTASARLSKILMERNMSINELVEHRERGSSHIHLADIFHNASREPNPPEPFLSKSSIEPISKETYPLRALLEANLHDPTAKATPLEPNSTYSNIINIPVVMDFGNNVNENGENMGIVSLFNNFTKITETDTDLREQPIEMSSRIPESSRNYKYETSRESRTLNADKDLVTWKEIIAIMHRGQKNSTNEVAELTTKEISPAVEINKIVLDDLVDSDDDDNIIMVNNMHQYNNIDSHISLLPDQDISHNLRERTEFPESHGQPNNTSNSAKSVTVATASIIGLAMVLFLLTYVTYKWKQQRSLFRQKERLRRDRIPTPVFETRKGQKINSSTRSKSPMISSSNIYTIETSDMRNGHDSPEYMWDSLRKPFQ